MLDVKKGFGRRGGENAHGGRVCYRHFLSGGVQPSRIVITCFFAGEDEMCDTFIQFSEADLFI